jgi:hypothetical protein
MISFALFEEGAISKSYGFHVADAIGIGVNYSCHLLIKSDNLPWLTRWRLSMLPLPDVAH